MNPKIGRITISILRLTRASMTGSISMGSSYSRAGSLTEPSVGTGLRSYTTFSSEGDIFSLVMLDEIMLNGSFG